MHVRYVFGEQAKRADDSLTDQMDHSDTS